MTDSSFSRVVTHNSTFHCDDVVAVAILLGINPTAAVIRTRNSKLLADGDIAVDVFGGPFDHHQVGGNGIRSNGIPYASAGLVWRDFGPAFVLALAAEKGETLNYGALAEILADIDALLIAGIDAVDCGTVSGQLLSSGRPVIVASISSVISSLNINETFEVVTPEAEDEAFMEAVALAQKLLTKQVLRAMARPVWASRVAKADNGGPVLVLSHPCADVACGWTREVVAREHIKFVVFPATVPGEWRIKGAPIAGGSFETRALLPENLRGKRSAELDALAGTSSGIFIHKDGWIGGAGSEADILRLAELAVATV